MPSVECGPCAGDGGGRDDGISGRDVNDVSFGDWGDALKKKKDFFLQNSLGLLQVVDSYFYTVPAIIYMSYANRISYEPIPLIWQKA